MPLQMQTKAGIDLASPPCLKPGSQHSFFSPATLQNMQLNPKSIAAQNVESLASVKLKDSLISPEKQQLLDRPSSIFNQLLQ